MFGAYAICTVKMVNYALHIPWNTINIIDARYCL